jgi:hypothetical protein
VNLSFNLTLNTFKGKVTINSAQHPYASSTIPRPWDVHMVQILLFLFFIWLR